MNICMLSELFYPYLLGGAERRYFEIAKRLAKKHDVTVYSLNLQGNKKEQEIENVKIKRLGLKHPMTHRSLPQLVTYVPALLKALDSEYDVIDSNQGIASFTGISKKIIRRPMVATFHDIYWNQWKDYFSPYTSFFGKTMEVAWSRIHYDTIIANSLQTRNKLERLGFATKIEVILSGIDLDMINSVKTKKENKIVFVGRLVKYKNADILIRTFSEIKKDVKDLKLTIVGEGPEKRNLQNLAKKLGVKVEFKGFLPEKEKIREIKSSKILVNPSTIEGLGLIMLESMACGTVPIGLDLDCYKEFCNKKNSVVVKSMNSIQNEMINILNYSKKTKKMARQGIKTSKKFSWDVTATKVEDLYLRLLA